MHLTTTGSVSRTMTTDIQGSVPIKPVRYGRGAATLHWSSAIIIIALLAQGLFMTKLDDGDTKTLLYQLHVTLGYLVLILAVIRIVWMWRDARPQALQMPRTEYLLFKGVHVLLIAGSIVVALSGILMLLGSGIIPISPEVTSAGVDRSLPVRNAHFLFASGLLVLFVAHVGGVLLYQRRNGKTLQRMHLGRTASEDD
jgi:cytochrome b561